MKLLVKEKKGSSYRLLDCESGVTYRAFARDFPAVDFLVGIIFDCDYEARGDLLEELVVHSENLGDTSKERVEVAIDDYQIGDLIDGTPILGFGKMYAKKGVKTAYAYFR